MNVKFINEKIVDILLDARIDSNNAGDFQSEIINIMSANSEKEFTLDARDLQYISSSGLRVILMAKKSFRVREIYNVSKNVYEIMEMVGFTDIMKIEKNVQVLSGIEYEELGRDYFGVLYRKDDENIVKVFDRVVTMDMVKQSDIYARYALKYDIPAAFVFEPMMDKERLACVYSAEKNAISLSDARKLKPEKEKRYFFAMSGLLRNLHENLKLKDSPPVLTDYYDRLLGIAENESAEFEWDKIRSIIHSLPDSETFILRELSEDNFLVESHGLYLVDMCGLVVGSPLQELTGIYVNMQDKYECGQKDPEVFRSFLETYIWSNNEEELDAYLAVIHILEPIHRLMRILENKESLTDSILNRLRDEIIQPFDLVREKIQNLKEIDNITAMFEVVLPINDKTDGRMYISLDKSDNFFRVSEQKEEQTIFALMRDSLGKLKITEVWDNLLQNGKALTMQMCPISPNAFDCFSVDDVYFQMDDRLRVKVLKNRQDKLRIEIRQRTARKMLRTKTLLKNINISLYPGEMILLIGSSGAGKTTFMNAVTGYEKADATITKNKIDFYKDYEQIRHQIGFAPQQDVLRNEDLVYYTLKNAADLRLPNTMSKDEIENRIDETLDIFGLPDLKYERVGALSGGQRKRLSIAVEFIADPILFFLDEPDSGLDGVMARQLMEDLRRITGDNRIVVVISHSPDRVADLFDKVIVLTKSEEDSAGRLAFYGTITAARKFFDRDSMEEILKLVNRTTEGGEGKGQYYIDKFSQMI